MSKINSLWEFITCDEKSVHELRAFIPGTETRKTQLFTPADGTMEEKKRAFQVAALKLNDEGFNTYITLNPIKPSFQSGSAKDKDIACRNLLFIDIDRAGATKNPATDMEVKAAKSLAKGIEAYLARLDWPKPIQMMSGNGWHLYYRLDQLSNDDDTKSLIHNVLKLLAKRFNNSVVNIDTVVYNASRITKVPGTVMRKGEETEDRPYRKAVMYG
jgi:hypothetical protein